MAKPPATVLLPVNKIIPSRFQIRQDLGDLQELAESIRNIGLIEPILVRPIEDKYEIVHGFRRFMAVSQILKWEYINSFIRELTDQKAYEIMITENIQRMNLNPIEEARAFKRYIEMFNSSPKMLGEKVGCSEKTIRNKLKFLEFPEDVQDRIAKGIVTLSFAEEMISLLAKHRDRIQEVVSQIEENALATRQEVRDAVKYITAGAPIETAVMISK